MDFFFPALGDRLAFLGLGDFSSSDDDSSLSLSDFAAETAFFVVVLVSFVRDFLLDADLARTFLGVSYGCQRWSNEENEDGDERFLLSPPRETFDVSSALLPPSRLAAWSPPMSWDLWSIGPFLLDEARRSAEMSHCRSSPPSRLSRSLPVCLELSVVTNVGQHLAWSPAKHHCTFGSSGVHPYFDIRFASLEWR